MNMYISIAETESFHTGKKKRYTMKHTSFGSLLILNSLFLYFFEKIQHSISRNIQKISRFM